MFKRIILICLVTAFQQLQAQVLEIRPVYPQTNQEVTIIYRPSEKNAALIEKGRSVDLVFTSSTFYNLPWELPMHKLGNSWQVSFRVPIYATFASFYFQSGKLKDRPDVGGDFTIAVYKGEKRVRDGFFHESYSIKTQMPKSPDLLNRQIDLLSKEITGYPDNFEAILRLKSIEMAAAKTSIEESELRNDARKIIYAKFEQHPDDAKNMARVAMGLAMIGESIRIDSLKKNVMLRYPKSDLGRLYLTSLLIKQEDSVKMITALEKLLNESDRIGSESSIAIHKVLFKYSIREKNGPKALMHASKTLDIASPNLPKELRDIALDLTKARLSPDSALFYAKKSLKRISEWPVGNIRKLPEFGYVKPFVADSTRAYAIAEAKSGLLSLIALNKLYLGDKTSALAIADESLEVHKNVENLINAAIVYQGCGKYKRADSILWEIILKNPFDNATIENGRINFLKSNPSILMFDKKLKELQNLRSADIEGVLKKQLLNSPRPEMNGITDLSGKALDFELLKGKVVIMDFWATWCVPCMKEMPYVQNLYNTYKDNPDVVFMVINTGAGNTIDDAKSWAKKNRQYSFPIYFNGDKLLGERVGFNLIPAVVLLDKNGKMQFRNIGFEGAGMEKKLAMQIEILLDAKKI